MEELWKRKQGNSHCFLNPYRNKTNFKVFFPLKKQFFPPSVLGIIFMSPEAPKCSAWAINVSCSRVPAYTWTGKASRVFIGCCATDRLDMKLWVAFIQLERENGYCELFASHLAKCVLRAVCYLLGFAVLSRKYLLQALVDSGFVDDRILCYYWCDEIIATTTAGLAADPANKRLLMRYY